jgi:DNA-binding PadR family transcriptional regulator
MKPTIAETQLTTLEYALLGLLARTARSGYDIHRLFSQTPLAHFSSSPGSIYPALKRLARRGLVTDTLDTRTEARPRRVYSLTDTGSAALDAWLRQPVTREEMVRNQQAMILRFSLVEGRLAPEEVIAYLEGYRCEVVSYLAELGTVRDRMAGSSLFERLALEHGIQAYEGQRRWIGHAIGEIAARSGGVGR